MSILQESNDFSEIYDNPLDLVEDVLKTNNWVFSRPADNELMLKIQGKHSAYNVFFVWQENMRGLQFCAQYDLEINEQNMMKAASSILEINEQLWMGHFEINKSDRAPRFRHTCLLRGIPSSNGEYIEDMIEIGLTLCEQYYSAFYILSHANDTNDQTLSLALMQPAGEG